MGSEMCIRDRPATIPTKRMTKMLSFDRVMTSISQARGHGTSDAACGQTVRCGEPPLVTGVHGLGGNPEPIRVSAIALAAYGVIVWGEILWPAASIRSPRSS